MVVSARTVLTAIALPPPFRDLPQAVLGAIVINAVLGFLRVGELRRIARFRREGFAGSLFALIAVLILGVLPGLILAIALSILMVMVHISRPNTSVLGRFAGTPVFVDVEREPAAQTEPGMLIFRPDAQMLFVNYRLVRDRVIEQVRQAEPPPRVVLADLSFSPTLDIESVDTIAALHAELAEQGVELWLANIRAETFDMLRRGGVAQTIDESRIYRAIDAAVQDFRARAGAGLSSETEAARETRLA